ncbi:MAG: hypothetical protein ABGX83_06600 [Nitrospira sp.]|nr:hypothetical protein [Candidatus Manganitrophaceae bacterium]HIL34322.1 hypothetical protein [Candidatus Manganitrophaceae bacterium]
MCDNASHPKGTPCGRINPTFNPHGKLNWPPPPMRSDPSGPPSSLRFPPFLRNPDANGGDIIPPTPIWKPFLWINPNNGSLLINPNANVSDPTTEYWADKTYAHGRPIAGGRTLDATVEAPRASGEIFHQFDDLFHDNAIFSPHAR